MSLRDFFSESDRITNVKIICRDGLVFTHKIIVAIVNNFFKDIISIIPDGDEVVLIMPGHEKRKVEVMLKLDWVKGTGNGDTVDKLVEVKTEFEPHSEPDPIVDIELDETISKTFIKENKTYNVNKTKRIKEEVETSIDYMNYFDKKERQEYQHSIEKLLEEMERKTSSQPGNSKEEKMFNLLQKQINYEKAKLDLLTGRIKTITRACKVHGGLNDKTLGRLFKEKKQFLGHSKIGAFSTLEEQTIINEFVQRNNGVKEYNQKLMQSVILEKIEEIQKSNPERNFSKYISDDGNFTQKQFASKIAKRFGITFRRTDKVAQFECEICCKIYTWKPSLSKHLRDVHFL